MIDPTILALYESRSERMLHEFGLFQPVREPIYRERMPADDKVNPLIFNAIERQGLMVLAEMLKGKS